MNGGYLLGVDFGGGASKATLLGADGTVAATHTVEYPTAYPQPGWAEQDPGDWYAATCENVRAVLQKSGISPAEIRMAALDAATHTAVLLDDGGRVLRPAIYWTDTRSTAQAAWLRDEHGECIRHLTLHSPDTIWTLPQLLWVREQEPEVWSRVRRILFAKDYVRYRLTGAYDTDYIEAQGSLLLDMQTQTWSAALCNLIDLPQEWLPSLRRPADVVGTVSAAAASDTGLLAGTPVCCGTTDTVMEVFASGAVRPGQMTVKLATAGRICAVTGQPVPHRDIVNYSHVLPGLWYPGTATKSAASSYRWYRDTFGGSYAELDAAAGAIPPGCDGLLFHPYLNGELTPYADPFLRGSFTGVRAGHTKAHFSRAVLEGVAFSLLECLRLLEDQGVPHEEEAAIIGGGASSLLWRQIVADMLGLPLRQMEHSDSSFGSAMLAGVAAGVFADMPAAATRCCRVKTVTTPAPGNTGRYAELYPLYRQIHDALAPVYQRMG